MKKSSGKKSQMRVQDPGSATGWKTVTVREDPTDGMVDSGLTFAFIAGMIIAALVMLGYPFYFLGRWINLGLISAGLESQQALYATIGIGVIYLIGIIILSVVYRRTKNTPTKKKVSFVVRITVVIIPALAIGARLFQYYQTHSADAQGSMPAMSLVFVAGVTLIFLFVFWKLTTKFIIPRRPKA